MKPRSAKNKGAKFQNQVRLDLIEHLGLDPDKVVTATMGTHGEDVRDFSGKLPLSIECKNVERLNIWRALDQAQANSKGKTPCVVFRRNRSGTYATVPWPFLLKLLSRGS